MPAVDATSNVVTALSLIAPLFSVLTEAEYGDVSKIAMQPEMRVAIAALAEEEARTAPRTGEVGPACTGSDAASFNGGAAGGLSAYAVALPSWEVRSTLQNEVLLPGMPLAALPVESLYKPWSSAPGNAFGAQRGLYLGDAARHLQSVYATLQIEVPARFAAAPDHLALTLDLLALFLQNGNAQAAADVARDHLDWLDDYDAALACSAEEAARSERLDGARRAALAEGIVHLRALVALAGRAARAAQPGLSAQAAPGEMQPAACAATG